MILHHLICLIGVYFCLTYEMYIFHINCILFCEISTIFLNIKWFNYNVYNFNKHFVTLNNLLFLISFISVRVLLFTYIIYDVQTINLITENIIVKNIILSFMYLGYLLNLYWFRLILKKIYSIKHKT